MIDFPGKEPILPTGWGPRGGSRADLEGALETSQSRDGDLAEVGFCEILAELCRNRETGVLRLSGGSAEKSVYLQGGNIVFAASKDPDDRLGELLLTREVIHRQQLEEATHQVGPGRRLGTVLVEMGILPAEDLPRWVREQVKEILFSLFSWTEGSYRFEAGPFPSREAITLRLSTAEVFLSGLRQVQKWSVLRKGAGEIRLPYRLSQEYREALRDVTLGGEEKKLLALLQSKPTTMEQAALESGLSTLRVYQLFFAYRVLGVVVPHTGPTPAQLTPARDVLIANASDAPRITLADPSPVQAETPSEIQPSPAPAKPAPGNAFKQAKPAAPTGLVPSVTELDVELAQQPSPPPAKPAPAKALKQVKPAEPTGSVPSVTELDVELAQQPPQTAVEVGAQTVIFKMPTLPQPVVQKRPERLPAEQPLEAATPVAPVILDAPPKAKPAIEKPAKSPGSGSPSLTSRPIPVVSKEGADGRESAPVKETSSAPSNAAKRGKADFRVVRVEGERLDGNGAQQIEDLLKQWSGKGFRLAGVVPGKKEGIFGSSGSCFFVFERDHQS